MEFLQGRVAWQTRGEYRWLGDIDVWKDRRSTLDFHSGVVICGGRWCDLPLPGWDFAAYGTVISANDV